MNTALLLAAALILASSALAQSPVTANAGNNLTQINKPVNNAPSPAKLPSKPGPPSKKPSPGPAPAKPVVQSSNNNQLQSANSNANANGNNNQNTAAGGAGGSGSGIGIAAGGNAKGGSASSGSSADGTNSVDSSNHSVSNTDVHELFIPPVVPPTPASTLAVGNISSETLNCGPLERVIKTPVTGSFYGLVKKSKVDLGFTEELAPYIDDNGVEIQYKAVLNPDGSTSYYGHQVILSTAILGTSGARSIAGGGGAGSGGWGQGGLGSSSSNQQLVTTIVLHLCEAERVRREVVAEPVNEMPAFPPQAPIQPDYLPQGAIPATSNDMVYPRGVFVFGADASKPLKSHKHKAKHHDPACVTLSVR